MKMRDHFEGTQWTDFRKFPVALYAWGIVSAQLAKREEHKQDLDRYSLHVPCGAHVTKKAERLR